MRRPPGWASGRSAPGSGSCCWRSCWRRIAVAATGPIAFVAFLAPNIGRRLARTSGAGKVVAACTVGALLVLAADILARRIVAPAELPVGIVTILLGAPYFLYLLARSDRVGATHDRPPPTDVPRRRDSSSTR